MAHHTLTRAAARQAAVIEEKMRRSFPLLAPAGPDGLQLADGYASAGADSVAALLRERRIEIRLPAGTAPAIRVELLREVLDTVTRYPTVYDGDRDADGWARVAYCPGFCPECRVILACDSAGARFTQAEREIMRYTGRYPARTAGE